MAMVQNGMGAMRMKTEGSGATRVGYRSTRNKHQGYKIAAARQPMAREPRTRECGAPILGPTMAKEAAETVAGNQKGSGSARAAQQSHKKRRVSRDPSA